MQYFKLYLHFFFYKQKLIPLQFVHLLYPALCLPYFLLTIVVNANYKQRMRICLCHMPSSVIVPD